MDVRMVSLGALLLFVSSVVSMRTASVGPQLLFLLSAVASLALAAGSLLFGAIAARRPV